MTRTTIATAVTASALAAALLSGCGGGGQPAASGSSMPNLAPAPSSATSSSAPATSSPTSSKASRSVEMAGAPGVPQPARMHTKAGAKAFVAYYFDQVNLAWSTPTSGLLPPLSQPACQTCQNYEDTAAAGESSGEHLDGPNTKLLTAEVQIWSNRAAEVITERQQNRREILNGNGDPVETIPGGLLRNHLKLAWTDDGWRMNSIQAVE